MILIVDPEQPMVRTPKGTVQKKETVKAYTAKINALCAPLFTTQKICECLSCSDTTLRKLLISHPVTRLGRPPGMLRPSWDG